MILVFDLDDTLFDERQFVLSGFKEVAKYLNENYSLSYMDSLEFMTKELDNNGRGKIFDSILKHNKIYNKLILRKIVSVFRLHKPDIYLNQDAADTIQRFKSIQKFVVTDGNKIVQKNKCIALDLYKYFNRIFITHQYGLDKSKPSTFCFEKIAELNNTSFHNIIYVGDNPYKDFINLKKIGCKTIRILRGRFKDLILDEDHEAHVNIHSLNEIDNDLLRKLEFAK